MINSVTELKISNIQNITMVKCIINYKDKIFSILTKSNGTFKLKMKKNYNGFTVINSKFHYSPVFIHRQKNCKAYWLLEKQNTFFPVFSYLCVLDIATTK